jgi:hypothetical protein
MHLLIHNITFVVVVVVVLAKTFFDVKYFARSGVLKYFPKFEMKLKLNSNMQKKKPFP